MVNETHGEVLANPSQVLVLVAQIEFSSTGSKPPKKLHTETMQWTQVAWVGIFFVKSGSRRSSLNHTYGGLMSAVFQHAECWQPWQFVPDTFLANCNGKEGESQTRAILSWEIISTIALATEVLALAIGGCQTAKHRNM